MFIGAAVWSRYVYNESPAEYHNTKRVIWRRDGIFLHRIGDARVGLWARLISWLETSVDARARLDTQMRSILSFFRSVVAVAVPLVNTGLECAVAYYCSILSYYREGFLWQIFKMNVYFIDTPDRTYSQIIARKVHIDS